MWANLVPLIIGSAILPMQIIVTLVLLRSPSGLRSAVAFVSGMTVLGMMGEAQKLSDTESATFAKYVIDRVAGRVPVIVGVSHAGTDNLVRLSKAAMDAGAGSVMVAPAAGLKTEVQTRDYFATIFKRLGPDIPVVYQDYPQATGVYLPGIATVRVDVYETPRLRGPVTGAARARDPINGAQHVHRIDIWPKISAGDGAAR